MARIEVECGSRGGLPCNNGRVGVEPIDGSDLNLASISIGSLAKPQTVTEARNALVTAGDRWRAEGSERAGWALDKAALVLIAVTYGEDGIR